MVSGFFTSPCDHSRIFSGLASEMRMAEKERGSFGFSKNEKMSRMESLLIRPENHCHHQSSAAVATLAPGPSTNSTFKHSDWSSLISTLKLSGRPASSAYSPLTMDSYMRVRP